MNERPTSGRPAGDEGFTLIEVMVALLVFAILSTGIVAGATTIIRMTTDNRARITAANLASQDLDLVRAIGDPFSIPSITAAAPQRIPIDGRTYTLTRAVKWISSSGAEVSCNSSANLFFLRVNVRVSWDSMLGTAAVQDDTILAPSDGTTDSETGAIGIQVDGSNAQPIGGVSVTVSLPPGSTGAMPPTAPKATTAEGCTYINDLKPGSYTVTITKAGYRGDSGSTPAQGASISHTISVTAGSTTSWSFTYDQAATYSTAYTTGPERYSPSVRLPSNLATNFLSGSTTYSTAAPAASVGLFPYATGYSAVAGPMNDGTTNCASVDPQAWTAGTVNGVPLAAGARAFNAASGGQTANLDIPLGVVLVRAPAGSSLTATQATPTGVGNPGCGITGSVLSWTAKASGGWDALQLPYGSWSIRADGADVAAANLQVVTNSAQLGVSPNGTVTLDPRKAR